ncbi:lactate utilization protein C [Vibrio harveyi]
MSTLKNNSQAAVHNRDQFLLNIANKLGRSAPLTQVTRPLLRHAYHQEVMKGLSTEQLKQVLQEYARTSLGTEVIETTKSQLQAVLGEVCQRACTVEQDRVDTIFSASPALLELVTPSELANEQHQVHIWDSSLGYEANVTIAERAKIGVVMAEQALAESGTVVLYSNPQQGRSISLLPESSVFVIARSTLLARLTQATMTLHNKAQKDERIPSCVNFISGPSSTADIELIKVVGVHGPVSATYIIVDDI